MHFNKAMSTLGSWRDLPNFPELVLETSLRKYRELPKRGKPKRDEEWTPLATVLCSEGMFTCSFKVGSLVLCVSNINFPVISG